MMLKLSLSVELPFPSLNKNKNNLFRDSKVEEQDNYWSDLTKEQHKQLLYNQKEPIIPNSTKSYHFDPFIHSNQQRRLRQGGYCDSFKSNTTDSLKSDREYFECAESDSFDQNTEPNQHLQSKLESDLPKINKDLPYKFNLTEEGADKERFDTTELEQDSKEPLITQAIIHHLYLTESNSSLDELNFTDPMKLSTLNQPFPLNLTLNFCNRCSETKQKHLNHYSAITATTLSLPKDEKTKKSEQLETKTDKKGFFNRKGTMKDLSDNKANMEPTLQQPNFKRPLPNLPPTSAPTTLTTATSFTNLNPSDSPPLPPLPNRASTLNQNIHIINKEDSNKSYFSLPKRTKPSGPRKLVEDETFLPLTDHLNELDERAKLSPVPSITIHPEPMVLKRRPRASSLNDGPLTGLFKESGHLLNHNDDKVLVERFFGLDLVASEPELISPGEPVQRSQSDRCEAMPRFLNGIRSSRHRPTHSLPRPNSLFSDAKGFLNNYLVEHPHLRPKSKTNSPVLSPKLLPSHSSSSLISKIKHRKALARAAESGLRSSEKQLEEVLDQLDFTDHTAEIQLSSLNHTPWFLKVNRSLDDLTVMVKPNPNSNGSDSLRPSSFNLDHSSQDTESNNSTELESVNSQSEGLEFDREESHKSIQYRYYLSKELASTEHSYLTQLQSIDELFHQPLVQLSKPLVPPNELNLIFLPLKPLVELSSSLATYLLSGTDINTWDPLTTCLGPILLDHKEQFQGYLRYIQNYIPAMESIQRLEKNTKIKDLLALGQTNNPNRQSLKETLILPIQRLTRYSLLLQTLLSKTPNFHPDHPYLAEALTMVTELAIEANTFRKMEGEKNLAQHIFNSVDNCPTMLRNVGYHHVFSSEALDLKTRRRVKLFLYPTFIMIAMSRKLWSIKHNKWKFLQLVSLNQLDLVEVMNGDIKSNVLVLIAKPSLTTPILSPIQSRSSSSGDIELPNLRLSYSHTEPTLSPTPPTKKPYYFVLQHDTYRAHMEFVHLLKNNLKVHSDKVRGIDSPNPTRSHSPTSTRSSEKIYME